ncbi:MAG: hypothetical protein J5870_01155, partial [Clostridia bacterium]|nr:hypothetical protein [Clostridia bacterium]
MKKLIAVLLVVLMVFSVFTAVAYAADAKAGEEVKASEEKKDDTKKEDDKKTEEENKETEEGEKEVPEFLKGFTDLFKDLDGKTTFAEFAFTDIAAAGGFILIYPLLALLQGLLVIVFVVLDVMDLDLSDLGIS